VLDNAISADATTLLAVALTVWRGVAWLCKRGVRECAVLCCALLYWDKGLWKDKVTRLRDVR